MRAFYAKQNIILAQPFKLSTYFIKDLIINWDQLHLSKGHFFHYLTWLLDSCEFYFVISVSLSVFYLLCVMIYPMYSFHHTNLLKEVVIMFSFCSLSLSLCYILISTFFILKYVKPKYYNVSIKCCGICSKLKIFGVVLQGGAYIKKSDFDTTLFFFYSKAGKVAMTSLN